MMRYPYIGLGLLSLLSLQSANANTIDTERLLSMSLEELSNVNITGSTLTKQNPLTVPAAVTVFTHQEMRFLGIDNLMELMHLVPGFQSFNNGGSGIYSTYSSRGRNIGGPSSEILMLLDGQRLDDPGSNGAALSASRMPLSLIERVEFIRGPGSAIYGSNALLGIVNIISRKKTNEFSINTGSFDRLEGTALAHYQQEQFSIDAYIQTYNDNGDSLPLWNGNTSLYENRKDSRERQTLNLTLTNNNTQLNIQHHFIESEKFLEDLRDSTTNTASLKQQFSYANIDSSLTLAYHENSQELFNETFPAGHPLLSDEPTGTVPLYAYISSDFKAKEFQLNWFNDAQLSDQHWIYGIEYRSIRTDDVLLQTNYDLYGGGFDYFDGEFKDAAIIQSKLERNILSVYTQVEFQPWQKNYVTIGLRYDNFNDIDNHFSPRLAWVITPSADQSIKFLYGHAFRAPTAAELNLQNTFFLGNPELEPEVVNTYELIWQTKQNLFDISVSYFENHFTDAIIRKYNTNHSLQYLNQNQDPVKGVEFELSHQLTQNTLVRVNASHFITLPDASFRESEQLFSFIVNHQIDRWNINLAASWYDESAMIINNNAPQLETLDDYWLVYAKIHYQFNHALSAYAQVKNALDDDYLTPPESESLPNGISNRSREVMFGISYTFD